MYDDRLATAYDPVQDTTLFRNLGRVDKYGLDGSIAWRPTAETLLYVFGSVTKSEIKNDLLNGTCSQDAVDAGQFDCTVVGDPAYIQLAGKRESGAPTFTLGARGHAAVQIGRAHVCTPVTNAHLV